MCERHGRKACTHASISLTTPAIDMVGPWVGQSGGGELGSAQSEQHATVPRQVSIID